MCFIKNEETNPCGSTAVGIQNNTLAKTDILRFDDFGYKEPRQLEQITVTHG